MRVRQRVTANLVAIRRELMELVPRHVIVADGCSDESAVDVERPAHPVSVERFARRVLRLAAVVERQRHHRRWARGIDRG